MLWGRPKSSYWPCSIELYLICIAMTLDLARWCLAPNLFMEVGSHEQLIPCANLHGILNIYLNDAYENPVSTATGADNIPLNFNWVIQFTNKTDHSNVATDVIPPPQIISNLAGGYYSVIVICFRECKYSVNVGNERNESVSNMPVDFIVTKGMQLLNPHIIRSQLNPKCLAQKYWKHLNKSCHKAGSIDPRFLTGAM